MHTLFKIGNVPIYVDINKTKTFYLPQMSIAENCSCESCIYFSEIFSQLSLPIFIVLKDMGVDLKKNVENEPTGVFTVLDDTNDGVFYVEQMFYVYGYIGPHLIEDLEHTRVEDGYSVRTSLDTISEMENVVRIWTEITRL
ncbi:MAG: hypothetical protein ABW174_07975 [Flavitalea sp.]